MDVRLIDLVKVLRKPLQLNAKAGDKIFILTDTKMDPVLWQGLAAAANSLDMEASVGLMSARATHAMNPISSLCAAALDPDTALVIYLTSTALAHAPLTDDLVEHKKRFILMEELTPAMLDPEGPAGADYDAMSVIGKKIADVFTRGRDIRVTCPNGTDLTASIEGRPGRSVTGVPIELHPGLGGGCAFPDGEAHVCPVEGTGEGTVVFDLTAHSVGTIKDPLRLTIEKGMVTRIEGGREADIWRRVLVTYGDANSYNCPAEIAIGLNPKVTPMGSMRTDKKMYGTSHIGIGDTIVLGGNCRAKLRLEGVISRPEIAVDGQVLTRAGKILVG